MGSNEEPSRESSVLSLPACQFRGEMSPPPGERQATPDPREKMASWACLAVLTRKINIFLTEGVCGGLGEALEKQLPSRSLPGTQVCTDVAQAGVHGWWLPALPLRWWPGFAVRQKLRSDRDHRHPCGLRLHPVMGHWAPPHLLTNTRGVASLALW